MKRGVYQTNCQVSKHFYWLRAPKVLGAARAKPLCLFHNLKKKKTWFVKSSSCVLSNKEIKILSINHRKAAVSVYTDGRGLLFCCLSSAPCLYRQAMAI